MHSNRGISLGHGYLETVNSKYLAVKERRGILACINHNVSSSSFIPAYFRQAKRAAAFHTFRYSYITHILVLKCILCNSLFKYSVGGFW